MAKEKPVKEAINEKEIPMAQIKEPQMALRLTIDEAELKELAGSIDTIGLIQAITVKIVKDGFEVIAGHRRFLACRMLGLITIRAMVLPNDYKHSDIMMISENIMRSDLNPHEEALAIDMYMAKHKKNGKDMADIMKKSPAYISGRLDLLKYKDILKKKVQSNEINISVARELNRITDKGTMEYYLYFAIENGATPKAAKKWADDFLASKVEQKEVQKLAEQNKETAPTPNPLTSCYLCTNAFEMAVLKPAWICPDCSKEVEQGDTLQS